MAVVPKDFDKDSFIEFYQGIGGDVTQTKFYKGLIPSYQNPSSAETTSQQFLNSLLGILNPVTPVTDIDLFYTNWAGTEQANEYADRFNALFFQGVGGSFKVQYNYAEEFSAYIIQYYFFFQKNINSLLPKIVNQSAPGYYPQTDSLYTFFQNEKVKGMGNVVINKLCSVSVLNQFDTVQDKRRYVSLNPGILGWCGCFTPTDPTTLEIDSSFPPECDPLCINGSAIKLVDSEQYNQLACTSTVCVISDIALNVAGSTNRQYDFSQICNACADTKLNTGGQPCRCIVDSEFSSVISKISADDPTGGDGKVGMDVGIVFERYCPNSICYVVDRETGTVQSFDCNKLNPAASGQGVHNRGSGSVKIGFSSKISFNTISLLSAIVVILIFMCLMLMIKTQKKVIVGVEMENVGPRV